MHNPKLAKAAGPLGAHFHPGHYSLSEREREIAVCIINSKWHSAYPTNAHERRGKEVGLPADKVEALIAGLQTSFANEREQVVYEMAMTLANSRWVPQGLNDRAVKALGHVGITDVITLMGYYTSVSMTLAFYRPWRRGWRAEQPGSKRRLGAGWGVRSIVPPVDEGAGPRLAPSELLLHGPASPSRAAPQPGAGND